MQWWSNSAELKLASDLCEELGLDTIPTEGSLGAKIVVPSNRLEEVISFAAKADINFWTSYENKSTILYILKQR